MGYGDEDTRYGHRPRTRWPVRWRESAQAELVETLQPVTLECSCEVSFPAPVPQVGSTLWCRWHGQVRVQVSPGESPRRPHIMTGKQCAAIKVNGEQCGRFVRPGVIFCVMHAP